MSTLSAMECDPVALGADLAQEMQGWLGLIPSRVEQDDVGLGVEDLVRTDALRAST